MSLFSLKEHRLNKKSMFSTVFENGNKVFSKNLVLRYTESPDDRLRVSYTIRKSVGNAVKRNSIKRIIRETLFLNAQNLTKNVWVVFSVNDSMRTLSKNEIRESVIFNLKKSNLLVE